MTRKEMKALAKSKLKGRWTNIVLLTFIITIIESAVKYFVSESSIMNLTNNIIVVPALTAATIIYVIKFVNTDCKVSLNEAIPSSGIWIRFIQVTLVWILFLIPVGLVFLAGEGLFIVMASTIHAAMFMGSLPVNPLILIWGIACLIGLICLLVLSIIAVFLFPLYYLVAEEQCGVFEAVSRSFTIMKGHKWELFVLGLSFLGWGALSILTFGIGLLWLFPYIQVTLRIFYLSITGRIEEVN